jgi:hypothetical protein
MYWTSEKFNLLRQRKGALRVSLVVLETPPTFFFVCKSRNLLTAGW